MGASSLFGSDDDDQDQHKAASSTRLSSLAAAETGGATPIDRVSQSAVPPIAGLHLFRSLLPLSLQTSLLEAIFSAHAVSPDHPQAMFFPASATATDIEACPQFLASFVADLPSLLSGLLCEEDYANVFDESKPLQTIINLYEPGKGIAPHVSQRTV